MKACNVIRDLLSLYTDDLCSPESRTMVEKHLKECPDCCAVLQTLRTPEPGEHPHPDDEKLARAAATAWKRRKRRAFWLSSLAILLVLCISVYVYSAYHPFISLGIAVGRGEDYYMELIQHVEYSFLDIQPAPLVQLRSLEFWLWNDGVVTKLATQYTTPKDIRVSGEMENGKTTVRYTGYATTHEGERVEIFEETTFDFYLCRKKDFLPRK